MSDPASIIGALAGAGTEAYLLSSGQPVGVTQAIPGGVLSFGTSATTNALLPIILIIAIAVVVIFVLK